MNSETPEVPTAEELAAIEAQINAKQTLLLKPKTSPPAAETPTQVLAAPQPKSVEVVPVEAAPVETAPQVLAPLEVRFVPPPAAPFQSSLTLDVQCDSPTAEIRYALGAASVDEHGMLFDRKDKIFLTQTTLVAVRAFENGVAGPLLSARFEIEKPQWQEVEPAEQSDATPHKIHDSRACRDGWQIAAASVRGKLHAHRGLWREDSFAVADIEIANGVWSVVAVADGAGSSPLSRVGSQLACETALHDLARSLNAIDELAAEQAALIAEDLPRLREALVHSGVAALDAIREQAQLRGKPLAAFASTLLILVRRAWQGAQLCAALQVGDGVVALWDANGVTLLGEADHGQHSSETRFLTTGGVEGELATRVKFSIKKELRAFAVMSDGVSDDYFPEEKRLGEVFEAVVPLMNEDNAGAALENWLGYEKKGSSDDRTLIVGCRATETAAETATEAGDGELQSADGDAR